MARRGGNDLPGKILVGRNKLRSNAVTAWHAGGEWLVGRGHEFRGGAAVTALALVTAYKRLARGTIRPSREYWGRLLVLFLPNR